MINRRDFLKAGGANLAAATLLGGTAEARPGTDPEAELSVQQLTGAGRNPQNLSVFLRYYLWFVPLTNPNSRWQFLRDYEPKEGFYSSADEVVWASHIEAALAAGVTGFVINIHGTFRDEDKFVFANAARFILFAASNYPEFEVMFEYDLNVKFGFDKIGGLPDFTKPEVGRVWQDDMHAMKGFFASPNYRKINGRPALSMFISTHVINGFSNIVDSARRITEGTFGTDCYFIGHEIAPYAAQLAREKLVDHIRYVDAINYYSLVNRQAADEVARALGLPPGTPPDIRSYTDQFTRPQILSHWVELILNNETLPNGLPKKNLIPTLVPRYDDTLIRVPGTRIDPKLNMFGTQDFYNDVRVGFNLISPYLEVVEHDNSEAILFVTSANEGAERTGVLPTKAGIDRHGFPLPQAEYMRGLRDSISIWQAARATTTSVTG